MLITISIVVLLIGLVGVVYPVIPGLIFMFIGAWLLAYAFDYQAIGVATLIAIGVLAALGTAMDFIASMLGARFTGASKAAVWGALLGSLIGMFFFLYGLLLGPLIGSAIGEWWARKDLWSAGKVSLGTLIGLIIGMAAKIGCALAILSLIVMMMSIYYFN